MRNTVVFFCLGLLFVSAAVCAASAQGTFTYADIAAGRFTQKSIGGLRSMADGEHYTVLRGDAILKYSYFAGELVDTLYRHTDSSVSLYGYEMSDDEERILLRLDSRPVYRHSALSAYAVYDIPTGEFSYVIDGPSGRSIRHAAFSPDGGRVAFVKDNDIFYKDLSGDEIRRVTYDGCENRIINGIPDWVYEEEFGIAHTLRWSPDGKRIAFLRFDESKVRDYTITFFLRGSEKEMEERRGGNLASPLYPYNYTYKYPKAGENNSVVTLHVYDTVSENTETVDTGAETDQYIPHFDWTPGGQVYHYRLNRLQNHLEVYLGSGNGMKLIYDERSPEYIDDVGPSTLMFLSDSKRFIVRNETRTGNWHLYMYDTVKGFVHAITAGEWEVGNVTEVTDKKVWFMSNETSPLRNNLYSARIDGKGKVRLTPLDGTYNIAPSRGCKYYISYFSNASTPNTVTLHSGNGKFIRTIEDNAVLKKYVAEVRLPRKEFFVFRCDTGGQETEFNCYIVRPDDFDPGRKYPLLITQYSGPGSQQVRDRWSIDWEDALVQEGYVVACMDPRGTGGRGEAFRKLTYGRMGELETEDQVAFATEMAARPYIDSTRVGIYGWSYGGFMSLNCIFKGADVFSMAISVAPVTSWRLYDSIYTERYNGLPQDNPEGYDAPSPIFHAALLKGKLLMIHGSADDNVHAQNTHKMASELVKAGKQFDMMIYTDDNHSMMPAGRHNARQKMVDYCLENL